VRRREERRGKSRGENRGRGSVEDETRRTIRGVMRVDKAGTEWCGGGTFGVSAEADDTSVRSFKSWNDGLSEFQIDWWPHTSRGGISSFEDIDQLSTRAIEVQIRR
jgi:hypothetical protein